MRIGCRYFSLPVYFNQPRSLIKFDNLNNNLFFWFCIAYYYVKRCDRFTQLAIKLYREFIRNLYSINEYKGCDKNNTNHYKVF